MKWRKGCQINQVIFKPGQSKGFIKHNIGKLVRRCAHLHRIPIFGIVLNFFHFHIHVLENNGEKNPGGIIRMKKRIIASILTCAMTASLLIGCLWYPTISDISYTLKVVVFNNSFAFCIRSAVK